MYSEWAESEMFDGVNKTEPILKYYYDIIKNIFTLTMKSFSFCRAGFIWLSMISTDLFCKETLENTRCIITVTCIFCTKA